MRDDDNVGDIWRAFKQDAREKRLARQEDATNDLLEWAIENAEIQVNFIMPWHIRLSRGVIMVDIFPQSKKWHDVNKDKRGNYRNIIEFLNNHFG